MKNLKKKAFTLVELLIVIAIIGILAVTVLLALNPAEAQKKTRDSNRVKDVTTIQAALEQLIDSGITIPSGANQLGSATGAVSSGGLLGANAGLKTQNCASDAHWMGTVNLCPFIKTVPLDPANGSQRSVANPATAQDTTSVLNNITMSYRVRISGSDYEINVRQESAANGPKVFGDGGNAVDWFEVFSGPNTTL